VCHNPFLTPKKTFLKGGCDDNEVCSDDHAPVCGTDNVTHWNVCELNLRSCDFPELNIRVKHHGECTGTRGSRIYGIDFSKLHISGKVLHTLAIR
jgi:hypothetical protein